MFAQLYASSRVPSEVESIVRGFVEHDLLRNDFVKNLTEIALVMDVEVEDACTSANDDGLHFTGCAQKTGCAAQGSPY